MSFFTRVYYWVQRSRKALVLFFIVAGPGFIVMIADNDAGGITTYAATGASYGSKLNWFLILLLPVAYFVQEMTVRLGVVTKHGHAEAIFGAFGLFWGWFSLLDLVLTDWLTQVTEFSGMTSAMGIFGVPRWLTVLGVLVLMSVIILSGKYWTWEKITIGFCVLNLIYIPMAFMVHPDPRAVFGGMVPNIPGGFNNQFFFFIMANIGTTIAPWMIFFQQSAVVDKGLQEKDVRWSKIDTLIGSIFTVLTAIFIVVSTGTLLYGQNIDDAAQASREMMKTSQWVGTFMAIGLFDAGLLGAVCISLASSWAWGEVFGWAHSLNRKIRESPWFYVVYIMLLALAGSIVLIPKAPLVLITLFVQVVAVTLLPSALVFLLLLLNDRKLMGDRLRNTVGQNVIVTFIVAAIIVMSTLYALSAIFPDWFSGNGPTLPFLADLGSNVAFLVVAALAAVAILSLLFRPVRAGLKPLASGIGKASAAGGKALFVLLKPVGRALSVVFLPIRWLSKISGLSVRLREVRSRYAVPTIKMTGAVKFALFMLRLYLLVLVGLLVFKFVLVVSGH